MKIVNISLMFIALVFISSCGLRNTIATKGSGNVIKETREVSNYKILSLATPGNVYISQGETESLVVEADDNLMKNIITSVEDGILVLKTNKSLCCKKMNFYVTMKNIKGFKILGSGNMYGKTPIKSDDFFLKISGSGDMKFDSVDAFKTGILIQGSGDIKMNGKSDKCSIEINGSGDIHAPDYTVNFLDVEINGSGDTRINVNKDLNVEINGSGDVFYTGDPENVKININGSGDVRKKSKKNEKDD